MKAGEKLMNNKKIIYILSALCVLLLISACSTNSNSNSKSNTNKENAAVTQPPETNQENNGANVDDSANSDEEILIIIDQSPKPIEGNSFDFAVDKLPEGFALAEMQWISKDNSIVNSVQDAIQHGADGEDGFYISGNGQFMGFIYPDTMKGEEGQVIFLFKNAEGKELTWKKTLTLN
jgi:hypothetical protein